MPGLRVAINTCEGVSRNEGQTRHKLQSPNCSVGNVDDRDECHANVAGPSRACRLVVYVCSRE